ncbi:MAG: beta-ketoacyl-[acyl-carrier-protein] synthase II [Candidatus Zixiibacteriota bacterium]|nr:MAG: beta-ketoacyl-[acyl-carrier-protein] synthase II [candidate division Zixibacteria bacterium]HDL04131.1 beta-ketoacyl-[acyl-carrier-protein] synthase II [candidate division Zixibacteria bacterium]
MERVRTVVTGMGAVTPLGSTLNEYWQALLKGECGIDTITRFDVADYPSKVAAEVSGFDPADFLDKKESRRMDLSEQYAVAASQMAIGDSGLDLESIDPFRAGVIIASGIGGIGTFEKQHEILLKSGPGRVSPFFIPMMIIDMCAGLVAMRFGFRGANYATVSACSSSSHALLDAFKIIQRGDADVMIAGGTEATITPTALAGFCSARALSTRNDEPKKSSRPFDKDRDGFVMGEGAGILILESLESAKARGARIYAEIIGAGMTCDAHHMTAPIPDGSGAKMAMVHAIKDAGLKPDDIQYINSHGTATGLGDPAETKAIKAVFGERAYKIPINSTKSMVGHLLGAGGAIELIASIMSLQDGILHPTINLDNPDPECDLDYVPHNARELEFDTFLSNSFGFGGHNVTLAGRRFNG